MSSPANVPSRSVKLHDIRNAPSNGIARASGPRRSAWGGNESLILLNDSDFGELAKMTREQPCVATPPAHYQGGGRISEYRKDHITVC
jgi:hypothetical protein